MGELKMNKIELYNGDCLQVMDELIERGVKVDAIITDPPYGTVKGMNYKEMIEFNSTHDWDETIEHGQMLDKCNKLLRMNGALILFSQEPYTSFLRTNTHGNLPFSYDLTWLKDNYGHALLAKKAPLKYTEDINVFFKKYDTDSLHPLRKYAETIKEFIGKNKKDVFQEMGHQGVCHFYRTDSTQFGLCTEKTYNELIELYNIDKQDWFKPYNELVEIDRAFSRVFNLPQGKKYKSNVLEYKKDYQGLHPTQKPVKLMEDLVYTYTNEGMTVLDFTAGSCSTGVACKNLNRNFIGIELSREYYQIAESRINES